MKLQLALAILLSQFSALQGAMTVEISGNIAASGGTVTLPEMSFVMTSTASNDFLHINFIDWTTSDGNVNFSISPGGLIYKINGGGDITLPGAFITDNLNSSSGVITPDTGYVGSTSQTFSALIGQTVTIPQQSFTVPAAANFNPLLNNYSSFNGTVYLTDNFGVAWANPIVIVPEPSAGLTALGSALAGLAAFGRMRRKRKMIL